jgi:hypothetical protein
MSIITPKPNLVIRVHTLFALFLLQISHSFFTSLPPSMMTFNERHISRKHTEDSMFKTFRADIIIPLFTKVFVLMDTFLAIAEFISSLRSCNNKFQLLWQQQTLESTLMKGNRKAYCNRQVKLSRN